MTEIVKSVPGVMLVVSIPASERGGADIEIGGENGKVALQRLLHVVGRVADQWRPSSKDESFEIVRRRLFKTPDADAHTSIAATARAFVSAYRANPSAFPRFAGSEDGEYEQRIKISYPLHPELLDRLYEDWSTLDRFQRTRGVLTLVSSIVHALWVDGDADPLILPGNVPLDDADVNTNLTQYLEDSWKPIIDSDIDGPNSTALQIDRSRPNLMQRQVTERLARTIFIGSAPRTRSDRKGLDKQYVWLGTFIPGDTLGNFGTALELLAQQSTYFYEEQGHYWFDTSPSVTKTANDYAERLREDPETVWNEIVRRLEAETGKRGDFARVHVASSSSSGEIPDLEEVRLVIAHPRVSRRRQDGDDGPAAQWVRNAIETKGASQRIHRNTLIFLVADSGALETLEAGTRAYLGWRQVQAKTDTLNLTMQQKNQADDWVKRLDATVADRIRDTYCWAMYPEQPDPTRPFFVAAEKVPDSGGVSVAERVSTKLKREEHLVTNLAGEILGMTLHNELGSLWAEQREISVGTLWEYFTRYIYLPRLVRREVLDRAVESAVHAVMVPGERFALATGKDDAGRYRGLVIPPDGGANLTVTNGTLLVDYGQAQAQRDTQQAEAEAARNRFAGEGLSESGGVSEFRGGGSGGWSAGTTVPVGTRADRRKEREAVTGPVDQQEPARVTSHFFGSVTVDPIRYSRDIGQVQREILDRLAGAGAQLEITIDIQATKPDGFTESEIRTITENASILKFGNAVFEAE
ncbi:MAG: DUF499 domain-containing protein [Promicromonosporaceae bacterium]|nr:DUF499 domain-containing protein [Promicromonosporaceae bacterium]